MKKVHFMGIAGSGCSGAAALAKAYGFEVSGCDVELNRKSLPRNLLRSLLFSSHDPNHLRGVDALIISPAILSSDPQNSEIKRAEELKIPVFTWQHFVGKFLQKDKFVIAVCGTHGKSTTTAMVSYVMEKAGFDPTVILGANVLEWRKNFRIGKSNYFVIEADEFNNNFLNYQPDIIALTNIEFDHPEFFANFSEVLNSFVNLILQSTKKVILVADSQDKGVQKLLLRVQDKIHQISTFTKPDNFRLKSNGKHNLINATIAQNVCLLLGIDKQKVKNYLSKFGGLSRRLEKKGKRGETVIFDDYAHHPSEINASLSTLREYYPKEIIAVVFQPHLFTRTRVFFKDFVSTFKSVPVDFIFLTDIFGAREKSGNVSSKDLVEACHSEKVQYIGGLNEAYKLLRDKKFDVLVNMGAGDIFKLTQRLLKN